ncbi:MAG: hypothetical protein KDK24_06505 [Pseudooceanicola sp.]|nr:hypothetical protein [Pseudooceanicola sp.]
MPILWPTLARAQGRGGDVILVIKGLDGRTLLVDEARLRTLEWHDIATHTAWTDGLQHFSGPLLRDVLLLTGAGREDLESGQLTMRALNNFMIEMPASDAWEYHPIVARVMNGQHMRVRDKGPLWIVYPRDDMPTLQDLRFDERWIWQLHEIDIE